jgi:hypothetical protein
MILASDIVKGVYRRLGRPAQGDLPYQDVLALIRDFVRELRLDLKLSATNKTLEIGQWTTPNAQQMPVAGFANGLSNFIPVKVEWRAAGSDWDTVPNKAEVVSYESLADMYANSTAAVYVAFYEGFSSIAFPEPSSTLQSREYRVICENLEDVNSLSLTSSIGDAPELLITYISDGVAYRALDYVDTVSIEWTDKRERLRPLLVQNWQENKRRFEQWKNGRYGNKKVTKQPARYR